MRSLRQVPSTGELVDDQCALKRLHLGRTRSPEEMVSGRPKRMMHTPVQVLQGRVLLQKLEREFECDKLFATRGQRLFAGGGVLQGDSLRLLLRPAHCRRQQEWVISVRARQLEQNSQYVRPEICHARQNSVSRGNIFGRDWRV